MFTFMKMSLVLLLSSVVLPLVNDVTYLASCKLFHKKDKWHNWSKLYYSWIKSRLVIGASRTVGSAKNFVRITSGFGGGEFTKTLRKVCTCQKLKYAFLLLEYCKIRECYAVANAFTIRNMYSLLLYMNCNSRKINRPTKNMTKIVTLLHL